MEKTQRLTGTQQLYVPWHGARRVWHGCIAQAHCLARSSRGYIPGMTKPLPWHLASVTRLLACTFAGVARPVIGPVRRPPSRHDRTTAVVLTLLQRNTDGTCVDHGKQEEKEKGEHGKCMKNG
ncbi:hypothetical protein HAX54_029455, partial [Datura stramonium]|nr:hypothetical protein [Datura stramonium]